MDYAGASRTRFELPTAMHRFLLITCILAALWIAAPAQAQQAPPNYLRTQIALDSGPLSNPGSASALLFRAPLRCIGATWMQVHFGEATHLSPGSILRIKSLRDGAVQRHDAVTLAEWESNSALFNGHEVELELIAGRFAHAQRVQVIAVTIGLPDVPQETICGPSDDRLSSSDPRVGRLVSGCTAWLADEDLLLTSGACIGTFRILEMNVPLSTATGAPVRSHPDDQYPYTELASLNGGIGSNWAVCRIGSNSNHGLLPTQRNGGLWYQLGSVPAAPAGVAIRITGYSHSSQPTLSLTQLSHVGPLAQIGATSLCYETDTSGGNAGSPILEESSGDVIGISTHGGCTSTGGCNSGTRIDRPDLQAALLSAQRSRASFVSFGAGCSGSGATTTVCVASNSQGGSLVEQLQSNEYAYALTLSQTTHVSGIRFFTKSQFTTATSIATAIYADSGGQPALSPIATSSMAVFAPLGWYTAHFAPALTLPAGVYHVSMDTTREAALPWLTTGTQGLAHWRRPFGSGTWSGTSATVHPAFQILCSGSGSSGASPALRAISPPRIGASFALDLERAAPSAVALLLLGSSRISWLGVPLPLSLTGAGAPGCDLLVSAEITVSWSTDGGGGARFVFAIPSDPVLVGSEVHLQSFIVDPGNNALNLAVSDGGTARIGG
jgi:V8-like Glu-specific endopeptidase